MPTEPIATQPVRLHRGELGELGGLGMLGPLRKLGQMAKRWGWRLAVMALLLWLGWFFLPKPPLLPPGLAFSRLVLARDQRVIFLTLTSDGKYRLPAKLSKLSPELVAATLEMEDRRFYAHHGADFRALARSIWGLVSRQNLGGGSTLTMQLARLHWRLETRSPLGKLTQVFRAIQLERHYSKQEILEAYFTCAPYGRNVEGAVAASWRWCGKAPAELTLREAASLSVLPQSPTKRRPRQAGNPSLAAAQMRLMTRLRAARGEPPSSLDADFNLAPTPVPRLAPHFALRRLREHPQDLVVASTLDLSKQEILENSIHDFLGRWQAQGLRNAAALLVHVPTQEVRAYVGSADFWNDKIAGQVDGVRALRSPGSALKPFIYALAFDAGLIQPHTLVDDAPRRFGEYNPENSDREFLGPIPAQEALRRSRNVPAIQLCQRLPGGGLEAFLRGAGVKLPRKDYGLALAIGAAEVTMDDLCRLYAGLAKPAHGLSPAACWLTLNALRDPASNAPAGLAWKTGTSNGFRDAWACGVQGDWVLCVWIGNFDAKPMPGLFARQTAAPLLWQTITRLNLKSAPSQRPPEVTEVNVCPVSGDLVGPHCPHTIKGAFIAGVSPITTCTVHQEIFVDADGRRVSQEDGSARSKVCEVWSAQRLAQFQRAGLPRATVPEFQDATGASPAASSGAPPRILSPQPTLTYVLRPHDAAKNFIPLDADAAPGVRQVYWFAGSGYLGASEPSKPLRWQPTAGRWLIQALDEEGRSAHVSITVQAAP